MDYIHTTYKAFLAKAAAGLMQEMVADAMAKGKIDSKKSWNDNEQMYKHLAIQARLAAETLADELEEGWTEDDHRTTFFDVQDSPTSRLEGLIEDVAANIEELKEVMEDK